MNGKTLTFLLNLVVSARTKATEALKSAKTKQKKKEKVRCPQLKRGCIRYDQRTI